MKAPYLPALLWMGAIFLFSTDLGATHQTGALLTQLIRFFLPDVTPAGLARCVTVLRKTAHVTEYAILAILWCRALRGTRWGGVWMPLVGAVLLSSVYAGLDEFHQSFVPSRTASVGDVGFDVAGALLGSLLWAGMTREIPRKLQFFVWWFLWGLFSTIMVLIVLQGGGLSFSGMILLIAGVGCLTGGVACYVGRR